MVMNNVPAHPAALLQSIIILRGGATQNSTSSKIASVEQSIIGQKLYWLENYDTRHCYSLSSVKYRQKNCLNTGSNTIKSCSLQISTLPWVQYDPERVAIINLDH